MKRQNKLIKEIKKWQKMLREEKGSLWASENETYMEEKEQLVKDLKNQLKGYRNALADVKDKIQESKDAPNDPGYGELNDWDRGYDTALYDLEQCTDYYLL